MWQMTFPKDIETGEMRLITPLDSFWYQYYIKDPNFDRKKFPTKF